MIQEEYYKGAVNPGDCISNGWTLFSQNFGIFFGMSTLAFFTIFFISCIPFLGVFVSAVITGPLYVGIYSCYLKRMRGEEIDFGMMFSGFQKFLPAFVVSMVAAAPYIIMQIVQLFLNFANIASGFGNRGIESIGSLEALLAGMNIAFIILYGVVFFVGIVVHFLLFFALPLIADRDISPGDALRLSVKAAIGNILGIILLIILEALILIGGVFALCIGVLFVLPLIYAANAFAFRQAFPDTNSPVNYAPPSPAEYGSSFGQGQ